MVDGRWSMVDGRGVGYIRPGILNKRLATFNYCARYLGWKPQMYHAPMDHGKASGPLLIFAIVGWAPERTTCSNSDKV